MGQNIRGLDNIISQFVVYIFVVAACTPSFAGKMFVVQCSNNKNHEYFAPRKLPELHSTAEMLSTSLLGLKHCV